VSTTTKQRRSEKEAPALGRVSLLPHQSPTNTTTARDVKSL